MEILKEIQSSFETIHHKRKIEGFEMCTTFWEGHTHTRHFRTMLCKFKKKSLEGGIARPDLAPLLSINADSLQIIFAMILFFLEMCNLFCNIKSIV